MSFIKYLEKFQTRKLALILDDATSTTRSVIACKTESTTANTVNELLSISGGILQVGITEDRAERLDLPLLHRFMGAPYSPSPQSVPNSSTNQHFISVEARRGVSTGISTADRATTIRALGSASPSSEELIYPGHVFPVLVKSGGVLVKLALPEAAFDLVNLTSESNTASEMISPAVGFSEVLSPKGELLSLEECMALAQLHKLPVIKLSKLVEYRLEHEELVTCIAEAKLPTNLGGEFRGYLFRSKIHSGEHVALVKGEISPEKPTLTRVQSEATLSDIFGDDHPDSSRKVIDQALRQIGKNECGVFVYLRSAEPGKMAEQVSNNRFDKNRDGVKTTYRLQSMRQYGIGAQILRHLGVKKISLLSLSEKSWYEQPTDNRPEGVNTFGLEFVDFPPLFEK